MGAGVGRELDLADGELALLVVGVEGGVGAEYGRADDDQHRRRMASDQEELAAALAAVRLK